MRACKTCGSQLVMKREEGQKRFLARRYCSRRCALTKRLVKRSQQHTRARKFLKPFCESCGKTKWLHAHHIDEHKENNAPENIQTLCVMCHYDHHRSQRARGISPAGMATRKGGILPRLRSFKRWIASLIRAPKISYENREGK